MFPKLLICMYKNTSYGASYGACGCCTGTLRLPSISSTYEGTRNGESAVSPAYISRAGGLGACSRIGFTLVRFLVSVFSYEYSPIRVRLFTRRQPSTRSLSSPGSSSSAARVMSK